MSIVKTVAMQQPNWLPWLGYFHRMAAADLFVFADTVAFSKRSYTQRVRIKTRKEAKWLSLPVIHTGALGERILDLALGGPPAWRTDLLDQLRGHYNCCPFFKRYFPPIADLLLSTEERLAEMNIRLIEYLAAELDIRTPTVRASTLHQDHLLGQPTDWIIGVCREVGAETYLSGKGGANYQDEAAYARHGIRLVYSNFPHPVYPQPHGDFVPGLSVVDLLFNCGEASGEVLRSGCPSIGSLHPIS